MNTDLWMRRGFSLLWKTESLARVTKNSPSQVLSLRQFFAMAEKGAWPEELPTSDGNALAVSGFEGCLDILSQEDAEQWITCDLKEMILLFQEEYEGQAALIFWTPSGRGRISAEGIPDRYYWKHGISKSERGLHIGRLLWSGAENEVERIIDSGSGTGNIDNDGKAWAGLYHPRIS
ncbi:MAG: hypothetical protein GY862_21265 [Gammaproteobacteria bacterium]|nr:hypothetical protein [Gammaproteobacteria bacterium]